jgi:hypothetical protein
MARATRTPLTDDKREGIVLAVNSAFRKLKNLYARIVPVFEDFGFTPPSAGVIARDLSEKIEKAIIQHCESFTKGGGHCDLCRFDQDWEVKICKDSGLTINQSKVINGENYIVVNCKANSVVKSTWVLWNAEDRFFSPRLKNSNARSLSLMRRPLLKRMYSLAGSALISATTNPFSYAARSPDNW